MKAGGPLVAMALAAACVIGSAHPSGRAAEVDPYMDVRDYPLSQVRLGRQVYGPRLSKLDFENRVTVICTWGITCPTAVRGLSRLNQLREKYRDRGLVVAAFHCRRDPWIIEDNIVHCCRKLEPAFPITRRGWVCPWPDLFLPWAAVFDHTGAMVFAGRLQEAEKKLVAVLDKAPDYLIGGPYKHIAAQADAITADRQHAGRYLPGLRKTAAGPEDVPAAREARTAIARMEQYVENRFRKALEEPANFAERVRLCREIVEQFQGDEIADRARKEIAAIENTCDLSAEEEAYETYTDAWGAFREIPPAGTYAYSMAYNLTKDRYVLARRRRLLAEFRGEMMGVVECYPQTYAASRAIEDLTHYVSPPMTAAQATAILETATSLAQQGNTPLQLYEALIQLEEILDGYPETNAITTKALALHGTTRSAFSGQLLGGRRLYDRARRSLASCGVASVEDGAKLSSEERQERIEHLRAIAAEAGEGSYLAGQATRNIAFLETKPAARKQPKAN